jgi:serine/threonine-protein kinase RsbW
MTAVQGPPTASVATTNGAAVRLPRRPAFRASFPADASSVSGARRALMGWLETCREDRWPRDDIALVVSEACTNVVYHAYRDDSSGLIDLHADVVDHQLSVSVIDTGVGMSPRTDSPGAGLGLALISALSKAVKVDATRAGTTVLLTFAPVPPRLPA